MSGEFIAIVSVGVGLAALLVGMFTWLRQDNAKGEARLEVQIGKVEETLGARIGKVEETLGGRIDKLGAQVGELHGRMAHLDGLLEGLRESISGRAATG